jgi:antitoxin component YwqK of YwqJK toxin-antitoxin module/Tfp pilus assembly protein PilF
MLKLFAVFLCFSCHLFLSAQENNPLINSAEYIKKGIGLHDQGKYKEAIAAYSKIDRSDTNYYQALYEMAYSLSADSQLTEALKVCEAGLAKNNAYWPQLFTLYGNLLDDAGQPEKALRVYDSAIALYPAYTSLLLNKGTTYLIQKKYSQAEAVFKQCILINPYESSAHYKLGASVLPQGKIIEAFLCYISYMLLQPNGKFQSNCITHMSNISKNTDEIRELANNRVDNGESPFALAEKIVSSKIALDKNYKPLIKLDDPITRQLQVMLEKLEYEESSTDFWMQYYVPLYSGIFKDKKFEPFVYRAFGSINIETIQSYLKKNKDDLEDLVNVLVAYFNQVRSTRELNYSKRKNMPPLYHFEEGRLYGKGTTTADGEKFTGDWEFYYNPGNIRSKGKFNNTGGKEGEWNYYHFNGQLRGKQFFVNDVQEGEEIFYFENGVMSSKAMLKNDAADGESISYFLTGQPRVAQNFKTGKLEGPRKTFYSNSILRILETYKADTLNGPYESYYKTGVLESRATYKNGLLEGPFKSYHENGRLAVEGQYKEGRLEGNLNRYHENGKLKAKENYANGELDGGYSEYYDNGVLYYSTVYKKGKQDGRTDFFDRDSKKFSEFVYDNNIVKQAKYFDKAGKEISATERKAKKMDMASYSPSGFKRMHAVYNDKGLIQGLETSYFTSGKVSAEINYEDGDRAGRSITYFPNGNKESENEYAGGEKHGYEKNWYMHGQLQSEGWYQQGYREGTWYEYDEMGTLRAKTTYLNDDIHGYREEYFPNGRLSNIAHYNRGWIEDFIQYDTSGKEINRCNYKNASGKMKSVMINGKLGAEGEYLYGDWHGAYKFYFPDGTLSTIQFYKHGMPDSTFLSYYYGGILATEGTYKMGDKTGIWKHYLENGKPDYTETYEDGLLHGKRIYYFENGKTDTETEFYQGYRHGWLKKYDPDGSLLYQVKFDYDVPVAYTYEDKSGRLLSEIAIPGGNGKLKAYFANGTMSAAFEYADGKLNGPYQLYYTNGKIRRQSTESYNLTHGAYKYFHPNGQVELDYTFFHDNLHGPLKIYNDKGIIIEESNYYNGQAHGITRLYDDSGKLKETRIYYFGDLLEIKK